MVAWSKLPLRSASGATPVRALQVPIAGLQVDDVGDHVVLGGLMVD